MHARGSVSAWLGLLCHLQASRCADARALCCLLAQALAFGGDGRRVYITTAAATRVVSSVLVGVCRLDV